VKGMAWLAFARLNFNLHIWQDVSVSVDAWIPAFAGMTILS